jgi:hypothetical protein
MRDSVAGVLANGGHAHEVTHFAVFGYHPQAAPQPAAPASQGRVPRRAA